MFTLVNKWEGLVHVLERNYQENITDKSVNLVDARAGLWDPDAMDFRYCEHQTTTIRR